jgi:hypothetical protein
LGLKGLVVVVVVVKPMMKLLEKNKSFEWTEECQTSFEELKKCVTSALVLVLPDLTKKV